jgi:hypothetical protein
MCSSGSNLSVSAMLFWLSVQTFAQLASTNASENSVAATIEPDVSETSNSLAESSEQAVLEDDKEVASVLEPEVSGTAVEVAPDSANS